MDHVIRTCDVILQDCHSSPILLQVIIVVMAIYYHGILIGGVSTRIIILYGDHSQWNNFFY